MSGRGSLGVFYTIDAPGPLPRGMVAAAVVAGLAGGGGVSGRVIGD